MDFNTAGFSKRTHPQLNEREWWSVNGAHGTTPFTPTVKKSENIKEYKHV